MIVAIHQPNYFPWLGFFDKIAVADAFIFLDDVQFSKNSYTNRVQILGDGKPKWITVPVSYKFGNQIRSVHPGSEGWIRSHLDKIRASYGSAPAFSETWDWVQSAFHGVSMDADIASTNRTLVEAIALHLGLECQFTAASEQALTGLVGDDRIISLVQGIDPKATYLSGSGGANYQDDSKFSAAKIPLKYSNFRHPRYEQEIADFTPGLSILDALFHLGSEKTTALLTKEPTANDTAN